MYAKIFFLIGFFYFFSFASAADFTSVRENGIAMTQMESEYRAVKKLRTACAEIQGTLVRHWHVGVTPHVGVDFEGARIFWQAEAFGVCVVPYDLDEHEIVNDKPPRDPDFGPLPME